MYKVQRARLRPQPTTHIAPPPSNRIQLRPQATAHSALAPEQHTQRRPRDAHSAPPPSNTLIAAPEQQNSALRPSNSLSTAPEQQNSAPSHKISSTYRWKHEGGPPVTPRGADTHQDASGGAAQQFRRSRPARNLFQWNIGPKHEIPPDD